ncbi:MAG: hypothetical protein M1114_01760 [Candidatus Dependentiae bacterium]|nr:hypothetical protein [Candidatus Dependentiae bacterium]
MYFYVVILLLSFAHHAINASEENITAQTSCEKLLKVAPYLNVEFLDGVIERPFTEKDCKRYLEWLISRKPSSDKMIMSGANSKIKTKAKGMKKH